MTYNRTYKEPHANRRASKPQGCGAFCPGWYGRYFHSPNMTVAHYDFVRDASIHEHSHPQEEVYEVMEVVRGTLWRGSLIR